MGASDAVPVEQIASKRADMPNQFQDTALASAKAALANANTKFPTPPASLNTGAGHGVGVAFAQAHGNDHTGAVPAPAKPQGWVQDAAQGLADKQRNIDAYNQANKQ